MSVDAKVRIVADNATAPAFASVLGDSQELAAKMKDAFTDLIPFATVGAAFTAIVDGIKAVNEQAVILQETAHNVGVLPQVLEQLQFAAQQSGVSAEDMTGALGKLNKAMSEAQDPASKQASAFKQLGISLTDANGNMLSTEQVLAQLSDKFAASADGPNKTAAAMELLGKGGYDLIAMLDKGSSALDDYGKELQALDPYNAAFMQSAEDLGKSTGELKAAMSGLSKTTAAEVNPALAELESIFASLASSDGVRAAAQVLGELGSGVLDALGIIIVSVKSGLGQILDLLVGTANVMLDVWHSDWSKIGVDARATMDQMVTDATKSKEQLNALWNGPTQTLELAAPPTRSLSYDPNKEAEDAKALADQKKAQEMLNSILSEQLKSQQAFNESTDKLLKDLNAGTKSELDKQLTAWTDHDDALETALSAGLISLDDYNKKADQYATQATAKLMDSLKPLVPDDVTNGLSKLDASTETSLEKQTADYQAFQNNVSELVKAGWITQEEGIKRVADYSKGQFAEMQGYANTAASSMQSAFANFLFDPLHNSFSQMIVQFLQAIQKMAADAAASSVFKALFGDSSEGGGLGAWLSKVLGGIGGSSTSSSMTSLLNSVAGDVSLPALASGGDFDAGKPMLVGEDGPELRIPKSSGTIIPNHMLGGSQNVSVSYNIDARGATTDLVAALPKILKQHGESLKADILDGMRRGKYQFQPRPG